MYKLFLALSSLLCAQKTALSGTPKTALSVKLTKALSGTLKTTRQHSTGCEVRLTRPVQLPSSRPLLTGLFGVLLGVLLSGCGASGDSSVLGGDGDPFSSDDSIATLANSIDITPIAYVRRPLPAVDSPEQPLDLRDLASYNPGARLYIRAGASINAAEFIISDAAFTQGALYDVKDVNVSPDGRKLLFAMHQPEQDPDDPQFTWNIWEYDIDSQSLRQITRDEADPDINGHDITPAYLASGDIVFASTRQLTAKGQLIDQGKPIFAAQVEASANNSGEANHAFNLHVVNQQGTITQLTFNQSHDFAPVVQSNGKILFSRWDNIANTDQLSLYEIDSDGQGLALKYGFHSQSNVGTVAAAGNAGNGFLSGLRLAPSGLLIGVNQQIPNTLATLGGDIIEVDTDNFIDLPTPTHANSGLSTTAEASLSPVGVAIDDPLSLSGRYLSVWPLHDGSNRLLVSYSLCRAQLAQDPNDPNSPSDPLASCVDLPDSAIANEPRFELWMYNPAANTLAPLARANDSNGNAEIITDVAAMEARALATATSAALDPQLAERQQAVLNIRSIYDMDGIDIAPGGIATLADPAQTNVDAINAKFLRIIRAVAIPDEDIYDFDPSAFGVNRSQLMREIVGYVPIEPDGSVRAIVPADVPLSFSVVDRDAKRINIEVPTRSLRHNGWLHLRPGQTLDCRGCHARTSTAPHGRLDAQAPSVHAGGSLGLPYPNTEPGLFAGNGGETMAEIYSTRNGIEARLPSLDISYTDDWTDTTNGLVKAAPFDLLYENLETASPARANCTPWRAPCASVINYETHIQPLWELPRTPIDDGSGINLVDTCVGCHSNNGGSRIPAAQLDLSASASDIDADQFTAYRELLRPDVEQVLNGAVIADRLWQCNVVDIDGNPVIDPDSDPLNPTLLRELRAPNVIPASLSELGANFGVSPNFFNCLSQDNACRDNIGQTLPAGFPDECIEFAGDPVLSAPTINHNGLLSAEELRLIAEWLDIGAQYYNNPFDAPE